MSIKTSEEPLFSDEKIEAHSKAMTIGMSDDHFRGFRYGMYQMRVPYETDLRSLFAKLRNDLTADIDKLDKLERSVSTAFAEFKANKTT